MKNRRVLKKSLWVEVVMIFLSLISGYLLFLEFTRNLTEYQIQLFDKIDFIIAVVFLCEFIIKFFTTQKRFYFLKYHWWELLTAIPITTPLTQALRLLRLLRLLHIVESFTL